jgi:hypothetical protein
MKSAEDDEDTELKELPQANAKAESLERKADGEGRKEGRRKGRREEERNKTKQNSKEERTKDQNHNTYVSSVIS